MFKDYAYLYGRKKWNFDYTLPPLMTARKKIDWQKLLELKDKHYLGGNLLIEAIYLPGKQPVGILMGHDYSATAEKSPCPAGINRIKFYPFPQCGKYLAGNAGLLSIIDCKSGREKPLAWQKNKRRWYPDHQEESFKFNGGYIEERMAIFDDIIVAKIESSEASRKKGYSFKIRSVFNTEGAGEVFAYRGKYYYVAQVDLPKHRGAGGIYLAFYTNLAESKDSYTGNKKSIDYEITGKSSKQVYMIFTAHHELKEIHKKIKKAIDNPGKLFLQSYQDWDNYFKRVVPYFSCSDRDYVRQYYYTFYCAKQGLMDIPYEPFLYPFSTAKLYYNWQWVWNSVLVASTLLRWLNDPEACKLDGSIVASMQKSAFHGKDGLGIDDKCRAYFPFNKYQKPPLYKYGDTIHEMWNGHYWNAAVFFGVRNVFMRTGDKKWLKQQYEMMSAYEEGWRKTYSIDIEGLVKGGGLDDYDQSPRTQSVAENYAGEQGELAFIDFNSNLYVVRNIIAEIALIFGDKKKNREMLNEAEKTKNAINKYMWDEETGLYYDMYVNTHNLSKVKTPACFIPLYAGIVPGGRKKRLIGHMKNPGEFLVNYPFPTLSIDHPLFAPDHTVNNFFGRGDFIFPSSAWYPVRSLVKNGEYEFAGEIVRRVMKLFTGNGISSAETYNPLTGEPARRKKYEMASPVMGLLNDLICTDIIGFVMREDNKIEFNPYALNKNWDYLDWGPFLYKNNVKVSVKWRKKIGPNIKSGYTVEINGHKINYTEPNHFVVELKQNKEYNVNVIK